MQTLHPRYSVSALPIPKPVNCQSRADPNYNRYYKFNFSVGEATDLARLWEGDGMDLYSYSRLQWVRLLGYEIGSELSYQMMLAADLRKSENM